MEYMQMGRCSCCGKEYQVTEKELCHIKKQWGYFSNKDRSEERRVGKSVDLGGRRIIKKEQRSEESEIGRVSNRERV